MRMRVQTTVSVEIRRYDRLMIASTIVEGSQKSAGNSAFRKLASFIFGGNASEQKIAMTAPVLQQSVGKGAFEVSFVMPSALEHAPAPEDDSVIISTRSDLVVAVIRYGGSWSISRYQEHLEKLKTAVANQTAWEMAGQPIWARYDPPFKPWFMRTNEIMVPVQPSAERTNR